MTIDRSPNAKGSEVTELPKYPMSQDEFWAYVDRRLEEIKAEVEQDYESGEVDIDLDGH